MDATKGAGPAFRLCGSEAQKTKDIGNQSSSLPSKTKQANSEWRKTAIDTLLVLRQRFPLAFHRLSNKTRRPLAIGIHKSIAEQCPDLDPASIRKALAFYVNSDRYLRALHEG